MFGGGACGSGGGKNGGIGGCFGDGGNPACRKASTSVDGSALNRASLSATGVVQSLWSTPPSSEVGLKPELLARTEVQRTRRSVSDMPRAAKGRACTRLLSGSLEDADGL